MPVRLIRSTPVRQALILVAVVALVNLASLGGTWLTMRADLSARIEAEVTREISGFDVAATPGALATLVAARARVSDPAGTVFVFAGDDGRSAGNAVAVIEGGQVTLAALSQERPLSDAGYVHEVRQLSGGLLIVAQSLGPIRDLTDTFLTLLAFSVLPTVLIALGIGALIARRSARRVAAMEATLGRIAAGDLGARYGPDAGGDDLARIGAGLDRMAASQQAATEALRQVTTDIAHDLRTPLQRISVLIEDLRGRLPEGEAADLADRAAAEAERAVGVFRALLHIAQIEGGSPRQGFRRFDLVETARRIAELYAPAAEDRGDRLALDLPKGPVNVTGDEGLIGQALANLIENALAHTPPGTAIEVAVEADGPVLTVRDSGPGIPAEERGRATQRLYRLERSRTTPGNGLGLSLVAAIATLHGARLSFGDGNPGLVVRLAFSGAGEDHVGP